MHVGIACQRPDLTVSVSSSIFVSSEYYSRLMTERVEVVEGWTAVAGAMPYLRLKKSSIDGKQYLDYL
jgi:hypothetical protein